MIARRWTSLLFTGKVLIDTIELPHHRWDVVEQELGFGEQVSFEAAAQQRGDGQARSMRRQDVVGRVAGDQGVLLLRSDALQRGLKDFRRRFRKLRISLRRRPLEQLFGLEERDI